MTRPRRFSAMCLVATLLLLAVAAVPAAAATRYDPRLRFHSFRTAHFTIHYHQGEDRVARRLAQIAERVRGELEERFQMRAPDRTHVVLVDQSDVANGWSTPVPYNLIELNVAPPDPSSFLGHHDDWLTLVFTHEYTHVMHTDQVGGWMRGFRWILGRQPISFPNLFLPSWQIEGIATYAEGRGTQFGRIHGADVAAVARALAAGPGPPRLDQLGGGLVAWPWGWGPYFYGGFFYDYLARRSGDASIGELTRKTARRLPFLGGPALTRTFGQRAATLWKDAGLTRPKDAEPQPGTSQPAIRRLTFDGYLASSPRIRPDHSASALPTSSVLYSRTDAHRFPAMYETRLIGGWSREVVSRYVGTSVGIDGDWVVYDQLDFDGPVSLVSDLYAHDMARKKTVRLTHGARLSYPDVSPDRASLAVVASVVGETVLEIRRLEHGSDGTPRVASTPQLRVARPGCQIASPRWSPDGRWIAAVLHCIGSLPEVVVINPTDDEVVPIAPAPAARDVTPAWVPDGSRLVFASDREGQEFRLYTVAWKPGSTDPVESPRLLVRAPGGAYAPDISPSGTEIVFLSATGQGIDVFAARLSGPDESLQPDHVAQLVESSAPSHGSGPPLNQEARNRVPVWDPAIQPFGAAVTGPSPSASSPDQEDTPYSPWSTLVPRAWTPAFEADSTRVDLGATIDGIDVLARHIYRIRVTWPIVAPAVSQGLPSSARLDWQIAYTYDRWWPSLFAVLSNHTDLLRIRMTAPGVSDVLTAAYTTREVFAGVQVPLRRVRRNQLWFAGATVADQRTALPGGELRSKRNGVRAGWAMATAREYGYSISPEDGVHAGVAIEHISPRFGADGASTTGTMDVRAYLPVGFPHSVLAVRGALGVSRGDDSATRVFTNGGSRVSASGIAFSQDALGLLRGFDPHALSGLAVTSLNADYRFPVARVERGLGTWPLFINTIQGAVFADVGSTGSRLSALSAPSWSTGVECAATITVGYELRLTLAGGLAWTHRGDDMHDVGGPAFFARTGYAF